MKLTSTPKACVGAVRLVSARVADADAPRLQAILDSSAVQVADRGAPYRKCGLGAT